MAKRTTAKAAVKVEEAVKEVEAVKVEEVKAEEVKAEEVKEEVKKAPAKKAAAKKAEVKVEAEEVKVEEVKEVKKAPAKKAAAKKAEVKPSVLLQFGGQETSMDTLVENAKKAFEAEGNNVADIKEIQIYVKPEEYAAYYVINGVTGRINLF